jgi:hypothetical protein
VQTYSPTDNGPAETARIQEWVNQAQKRGEQWGGQSEVESANTIRRALPVEPNASRTQMEPTVPPAPSPLATASVYATAPFEIPAPSPSIAAASRYRVVNVRKGDFLYLRGGPGAEYRPILRIHPGTTGIMLRSNRTANGSTTWQEISIGGYTGWVNEIYLEPEGLRPWNAAVRSNREQETLKRYCFDLKIRLPNRHRTPYWKRTADSRAGFCRNTKWLWWYFQGAMAAAIESNLAVWIIENAVPLASSFSADYERESTNGYWVREFVSHSAASWQHLAK